MTVGVCGLGLIGGSVAKAYKSRGQHTVYGFDTDKNVLGFAGLAETIDETLDENNIKLCDCIIIAVYSAAAVAFLENAAPHISPHTVVIDCCGTKRRVCAACFEIAAEYGFTYVGGHPMAGTQYSGFRYSRADLFSGASMIIVPPQFDDIALINRVKTLLEPLNFKKISVTTAEKHDEIIAFTSQLPHVISSAYIKSPTSASQSGFSAGSYKDLSRVSVMNEEMWTELFLENKDNLLCELDIFINHMTAYREALANDDRDRMKHLLSEGRKCKETAEGICRK